MLNSSALLMLEQIACSKIHVCGTWSEWATCGCDHWPYLHDLTHLKFSRLRSIIFLAEENLNLDLLLQIGHVYEPTCSHC